MLATKRRTQQQQQHSRPQRFRSVAHSNRSRAFNILAAIGLLLQAIVPIEAVSPHPVFLFSNSSTVLGQTVTSSTLAWDAYDAKDARQLKFAVEGGKFITEDEHYPIYVCRIYIDGVYTNGQTEKRMQSHLCVAGHKKYEKFDVLVNKGHLGKVAWKRWNKYNVGTPIGAILYGEENVYIARHMHTQEPNGNGHLGADFYIGRLEPIGFGKIKAIDENNLEKYYDEGDVLVETQPFRYELRDIKLDKLRVDIRENITELSSGVLVNRGDKYSVVETVLSYEFDSIQNWGTHEGTARGLPTKIFERDSAPAEVYWGLKYSEKRYETKSVHTELYPGTALNVTLKGNYVTLMAPYKAKLYAYYSGLEESVSREILAEVMKGYLKDVKLEYGPVYFLDNGTLVPTTTTTTTSTSTTSTTMRSTTTTVRQPKPIHEPPIVHVENVGEQHSGPDSLEKSLHDSPEHNEVINDVPENLSEHHQKHALAGIGAANVADSTFQKFQKWSLCTTFVALIIAIVLNI